MKTSKNIQYLEPENVSTKLPGPEADHENQVPMVASQKKKKKVYGKLSVGYTISEGGDSLEKKIKDLDE